MATKVSQLRTANKASNTSREFVLLSNIDSNSSTKLALNDVLPTLQSGKTAGSVSAGTPGTTVQDIFVGGGVGSSIKNSDKSILIFKGLNVEDATGALKIRTDVGSSDANKKNIVISLTQSAIDLNVASNTNAKFLSETGGANALNLATASHVAGILPVDHGGTGASTFTDGGLLVGNGAGTVQALSLMSKGSLVAGSSTGSATDPAVLSVGANNLVLIADSGEATGLKWGKPSLAISSLTSELTTSNNNINMGSGFIAGTASASAGLRFSTADNTAYFGASTPWFGSSLNVEGNLELGASNGSSSQTVKMRACSAGAGPELVIQGSDNADNNVGGAITINGGDGAGNANGGAITIAGGLKSGSGTDGAVLIKTAGATAITVDNTQNVTVEDGKVTIDADEGLEFKGTTVVTQATNLTTGVTLNSVAGVITLHATALNAAAEAEFTLTNSKISATSVIMLTTQQAVASTESDGATLVAGLGGTPGSGSCKIRLTNPGSAATSGAAKVNFLVINTTT